MKYDVFISYSRKDTGVVRRICDQLQSEGVSYFVDKEGISGGDEFVQTIVDAIKASSLFLFVASMNSYESDYASKEVTFAISHHKKMMLYQVDHSEIPECFKFSFASSNWINIYDNPIETDLISSIRKAVGTGDRPTIHIAARNRHFVFFKYALWAVYGLIAALLITFLGYMAFGHQLESDLELISLALASLVLIHLSARKNRLAFVALSVCWGIALVFFCGEFFPMNLVAAGILCVITVLVLLHRSAPFKSFRSSLRESHDGKIAAVYVFVSAMVMLYAYILLPILNRLSTDDGCNKLVDTSYVFPVGGWDYEMVKVSGLNGSDFYIGRTEVTQKMWKGIVGDSPAVHCGDSIPVESVTLDEIATDFIPQLNETLKDRLHGNFFDLPTLEEWRFASNGGSLTGFHEYSGSDVADEVAVFNAASGPCHVASLQANELGLYDMCGNVAELCMNVDGFHPGLVACGGSWRNVALSCSVCSAEICEEEVRRDDVGFRLAIRVGSDDEMAVMYRKAMAQYNNGNFVGAFPMFRNSARHGIAKSQFILGHFYYEGIEPVHRVSYRKAAYWFRKAAAGNDINAMYDLGNMYYIGNGVSQNYKKAVRWYSKAAAGGHAKAQNDLGSCYLEGTGINKDVAEAFVWFLRSAMQGNHDAQQNVAYCYLNGIGVSRDKAEAEKWEFRAHLK